MYIVFLTIHCIVTHTVHEYKYIVFMSYTVYFWLVHCIPGMYIVPRSTGLMGKSVPKFPNFFFFFNKYKWTELSRDSRVTDSLLID